MQIKIKGWIYAVLRLCQTNCRLQCWFYMIKNKMKKSALVSLVHCFLHCIKPVPLFEAIKLNDSKATLICKILVCFISIIVLMLLENHNLKKYTLNQRLLVFVIHVRFMRFIHVAIHFAILHDSLCNSHHDSPTQIEFLQNRPINHVGVLQTNNIPLALLVT